MIEYAENPPYFNCDNQTVTCGGAWTILNLTEQFYVQFQLIQAQSIKCIETTAITRLDSAGAELLIDLMTQHPKAAIHLSAESQRLCTLIQQYSKNTSQKTTTKRIHWLEHLGSKSVEAYFEGLLYLSFVGEVSYGFWQWLIKPQKILWRNICRVIESSGFYGLFIIGLLSFLIGIVLAYQMGEQLRSYGADIFVVNLLGLSILREFAPLITAIIVSGRTGSAFTAELGTMKVNQELDALTTMGVDPIRYLVLPKISGLVIALPLLSMWAAFMGLFGGMIMSKIMLGISFTVFADQFSTAVATKQLWIGLMKTPVFAFIIASIGCFQGLQVSGGAESVGLQTTRSVVQSLFLIIVADAFFSILLSTLNA